MTVNELISELLEAERNGHAMVCVQTPGGWEYVEIESVRIRKWGVEINSAMIDSFEGK